MIGGVFVVGALHLDVVVGAPHLPAIDETVIGQSVDCRFGGKGGNQAVAAARFGASTAMAGRVGSDQFGRQLLKELDGAGVDRTQVVVSDGKSGMSVAIVDSSGEYGAVIVSGANSAIDGQMINVPDSAGVVLLQNEIPEAANVAVARQAGKQRTVILNAAPAHQVCPELLDRVDLLIVNRCEAEQLTGTRGAEMPEKLAALGPPAVIATLGADGLILVRRDENDLRLTANPVPVVSTHGAGDAFVGALAAEMARGKALESALEFAQSAAAIHVSRKVENRNRIGRREVLAFMNDS